MRRIAAQVVVVLGCAGVVMPQGRPVDWPSKGGDARRSGWEKSDTRITKENVKDFQMVLKRKFEGPQAGPLALTSPVIIGLLISYKGFKELGFIAGNSGDLWSLDVDVNRVFWHKRFEGAGKGESGLCGAMATTPALTPPMTFGGRRRGAARPSAPLPARLGGGGFGGARPLYYVTQDGKLHHVNTSDGSDLFPVLDFLPANAKASNLLMTDNSLYATTIAGCGGTANGVWGLDLALEEPKPVHFPLNTSMSELSVGNDGTVYVQTGAGEFDAAANKWSNSVVALTPKDLKLKSYYTAAAEGPKDAAAGATVVTPVAFEYGGKDLLVSATPDGRLVLLDSEDLGGKDHKTPLSQTHVISAAPGGIRGGLSSWEDADGVRWVAAAVWGPVHADLKAHTANGAAPNGSIVAFRVEDQNGGPALTPAWVSRDLSSPVAPVVTSGMVFALSTGGYTAQGAELKPKKGGRATMFALDGATGKELYSTGSQVTAPGSLTGLGVANGRVFFTTIDNTLYAFGVHLEI